MIIELLKMLHEADVLLDQSDKDGNALKEVCDELNEVDQTIEQHQSSKQSNN